MMVQIEAPAFLGHNHRLSKKRISPLSSIRRGRSPSSSAVCVANATTLSDRFTADGLSGIRRSLAAASDCRTIAS
jgi:hypothetical protein